MSLFPIPLNRVKIWEYYGKLKSTFWRAEELIYDNDKLSWKNANKNLIIVLCGINEYFFTADNFVVDFIEKKISKAYKNDAHVSALFTMIKCNEQMHAETYDRYITFAIPLELSEKIKKFSLFSDIACVNDEEKSPAHIPAEWIRQFYNQDLPISHLLVAHLINEGIFFMSLFDMIAYLQIIYPGAFQTFIKMNEFIFRDETIHTKSTITLINERMANNNEITKIEIVNIFTLGVEKAIDFVEILLNDKIPGLPANDLQQTIRWRANKLLKKLNIDPIFNNAKRNEFTTRFSVNNRSTDFFTGTVTEYSKTTECTNQDVLDIFK